MKNKIKLFFAALLSVAAISGCKKEKVEEIPVTPPVIGVTHSVSGTVLDKNSALLADVDCALTGAATLNAKTDKDGAFIINGITKGGKFTLTFTKAGKNSTSVDFVIAESLTSGESKNISIQMVDEGVKKEIPATGGEIAFTPPTASEIPAPEVKFTVPANATTKTETITITPINDIPTANAQQKKELPILTIACSPKGLVFAKPCPISIPNPLGQYNFGDMKLFFYDDATRSWTNKDMAEVTYANGSYNTTVSHFSNYQISFGTAITSSVPSTESLAKIPSVDNFDGKTSIEVGSITYKMKGGYDFVITPEAALAAAGVTGDDLTKLSSVIRDAIISKNSGIKPKLSDVNSSYAVNTSIPKGVRLDISGVQKFTVVSYQIALKKGAQSTPITVSVKEAGSATITTKTFTKAHQGGEVKN